MWNLANKKKFDTAGISDADGNDKLKLLFFYGALKTAFKLLKEFSLSRCPLSKFLGLSRFLTAA